METRRIRRLARRRVQRTALLASSLAALGLALGMALPHSTLAAVLVFVAASACAVTVVLHDDARAPSHGLHHVIRLPVRTSVSATLESFWSRVAGSARALFVRAPKPVALALDEPDDEAEAWWGPRPTELSDPFAPLLADSVPPVPEPDPEPVVPALPASEPVAVGPVLSAPMQSAHVPADDAPAGPSRVEQVLAGTRRHVDAFAKRFRRQHDEAGIAT